MAYKTILTEDLFTERDLFYTLFSTSDNQDGIQAFIAKRILNWQGK
ncbi:MAG: hypothetical protein QGM50_02560 [Anaerolineae bacterium]|nr:hypothetical protein [Anaerolineae bacterium]